MFAKYNSHGFLTPIDGIEMKTFVYGENSLLTRFHLKKGAELPRHSHPQEQTIKGDIEHFAQIIEDSVAIEVFSPLREDYLPES